MNPREYEALFEVEDRHWWFVELRREITRALARFRRRPAAQVSRWLDAGSGTGGLLWNLGQAQDGVHVGIEVSIDGLCWARVRGLRRLVRGSVTALPFAEGSFDAVTSIDVLCHRDVDEPRALREIQRCLKSGGILVLQVPAFDWLRSEHDEAVWTNRRYSRREMDGLLGEAGFSLRQSFYRNSLLFPAAALYRLVRRRWRSGPEARSDVRPATRFANAVLSRVLRAESSLRAVGVRCPFGLSVFCVAEKTAGQSDVRG